MIIFWITCQFTGKPNSSKYEEHSSHNPQFKNMSVPQPNQIQEFPNGKLHYLFRKTWTKTDITQGLALAGNAVQFLRNTNHNNQTQQPILEGFQITLFTPHCNRQVRLNHVYDLDIYQIDSSEWTEIADHDGLVEGLQLDCWAVMSGQDHMTLLIQVVLTVSNTDCFAELINIKFHFVCFDDSLTRLMQKLMKKIT